jgi:putative sugar O-methyltransferase
MKEAIRDMFDCMLQGNEVYLPSKFWQQLNEKNIIQLESTGLQNIKRTVAQNYFTWVVGLRNDQFRYLAMRTGFGGWGEILRQLPAYDPSTGVSRARFYELCIFTRMLWRLAVSYDTHRLLERIQEPQFGNPFPIFFRGRLISQDLANSVLELYSILDAVPLVFADRPTVCELGAGYGRNAYLFLEAFKQSKYVIVDIPPALYVSQEYLARVLPDRKILRFSCFLDMAQMREQLEWADVAFLLPHQAELLAEKSVDLFINISSLHEMTRPQIDTYFGLIDRLTRGYFYMKQWKSFTNPRDGITIRERDYPYPQRWKCLLSRTARAQPAFFESVYAVGQNSAVAENQPGRT